MCTGADLFTLYEYTFGELLDLVNAFYENKRIDAQCQSVIAYKQAFLIADSLSGGEMSELEVYEIFPFWSKDEKNQLMKEKYMRMAQKYKIKEGMT